MFLGKIQKRCLIQEKSPLFSFYLWRDFINSRCKVWQMRMVIIPTFDYNKGIIYSYYNQMWVKHYIIVILHVGWFCLSIDDHILFDSRQIFWIKLFILQCKAVSLNIETKFGYCINCMYISQVMGLYWYERGFSAHQIICLWL